MATGGSEFMSDEIKSIKCCLCLQENRTTDAVKYCLDCKDYYCTSCVSIHQKINIMKGHKIQDKAAYNLTGSDRFLPSYPTQRCLQHPLEVVSAYCKDHDEVACALCMCISTLHRSCENILSIPDNIDDLYEKCNLKDIEQKICQTKTVMEEIKTTKENKLEELKKALNTEIDAVKALRKELDALLENMEQETIQELKGEHSRVEASYTEEIHKFESLVDHLNEAASELKKADGNKAQEFLCVKNSQKLIENATDLQKYQLTDTKVFFTPDHTIKEFLQKTKSFGKVQSKPKHSLYKVKQQRDIKVILNNDRTNCYNNGSCKTADNYLLLADSNNRKLKRLDLSTEKVVDYKEFEDPPRGVCNVSQMEAAVALRNNSVEFVTLEEKLAATHALITNHTCSGLAHKDGKLFVSDHSNNVYVYDINGQQQHKLTLDGPSSNLSPDGATYYAVCTSGNRVFVAHHDKGLIILDSQGNHLSTHRFNNESGYQGVCTDGRNVFLSVYAANKIVQIGPDFKMLGDIGAIENVGSIMSLCFDHNKTRLIVTSTGSDNIKYLELE